MKRGLHTSLGRLILWDSSIPDVAASEAPRGVRRHPSLDGKRPPGKRGRCNEHYNSLHLHSDALLMHTGVHFIHSRNPSIMLSSRRRRRIHPISTAQSTLLTCFATVQPSWLLQRKVSHHGKEVETTEAGQGGEAAARSWRGETIRGSDDKRHSSRCISSSRTPAPLEGGSCEGGLCPLLLVEQQ